MATIREIRASELGDRVSKDKIYPVTTTQAVYHKNKSINNIIDSLINSANSLEEKQGDLNKLNTPRKDNLVNSINDVYDKAKSVDDKQPIIQDLDAIRFGAKLGSTALQKETDPTVPLWAKQKNKPSYTYDEVGALSKDTKLSQIPNDAGFITKLVKDLTNYYDKQTIDQKISGIKQFDYRFVNSLPTASKDTMFCIYLVPSSKQEQKNIKDEYITIFSDGAYKWEQIGSTAIDLSDYAKKERVEKIEEKTNHFNINNNRIECDIDLVAPNIELFKECSEDDILNIFNDDFN